MVLPTLRLIIIINNLVVVAVLRDSRVIGCCPAWQCRRERLLWGWALCINHNRGLLLLLSAGWLSSALLVYIYLTKPWYSKTILFRNTGAI